MSSNLAWRGQLKVRGVPVDIELWSRAKQQRNESFKTIAPSGKPVKRVWHDTATNAPVAAVTNLNEETGEIEVLIPEERKGVEIGKDEYAIVSPDAISKIEEGTKSESIEPERFVPLSTLDLDLAIDRFAVRPMAPKGEDPKPMTVLSLDIVWNGLRVTKTAWLSQFTIRGGKHDAILALYATGTELLATLLPFEAELYDIRPHQFTPNEQYAQKFSSYIERQGIEAFDHSVFKSGYRTRRAEVIAAVIADEEIPTVEEKVEELPKIDLLAALELPDDAPKAGKPTVTIPEKEEVEA